MFKDAPPANEALRVLVSGTADFVIPALVSTALKDAGIAAKITIVDRCQTPLELCRVAAEQFEFNWQYLQSDILDLHFDEPFGLIATDRLLGHIPSEVRTPVLDKFGSLLSPIGWFVTIVSVRPSGRPSSKDANALIRRLNESKEKCREQGQYSLSELTRMVKSYANSHSTYAIRNCDSLEKMFETSAMVIRAINHVETDPRLIRGKDPVGLVKLVAQRR